MRRRKSWVRAANSAFCNRSAVVAVVPSTSLTSLTSLTAISGSTLGSITSIPVAESMETNPLPISHRWDSPNLDTIVVLSLASVR